MDNYSSRCVPVALLRGDRGFQKSMAVMSEEMTPCRLTMSTDTFHLLQSLAAFIRQHEKALANSLQLSVTKKQHNLSSTSLSGVAPPANPPTTNSSTSNSLAAAFSFAGLNFMSHNIKPAHLTLTPHHLFYLLSRLEELDVAVGPMNIRLENIHNESSHANYVSFLQDPKAGRRRTDRDSLHSVSSVRSVMSSMSAFWSHFGFGGSVSKSEKAKAAIEADLKYLYSAFTKLPSLRLSHDHRARLIKGYEEFPFDTAVPLFAFKNVQHLDIVDVDFRQFFGWDRLAEQLSLLTVKRANLDDPADLITNIVLDDAERRRRRSTKAGPRTPTPSWTVPSTPRSGYHRSNAEASLGLNSSPDATEPVPDVESGDQAVGCVTPQRLPAHGNESGDQTTQLAVGSTTPQRPAGARPGSSYRHFRTYSSKAKRSGSGSSDSSEQSGGNRLETSAQLFNWNVLPPNKWLRLKYLSLADNSLTTISATSIQPLANSLRSLNLSSNLFTEIPDSLASLTRLNSLDLSNCMIDSLHSLTRSPLPAITTIKLRSNRLTSLAGVERLLSLENLDVQDNKLSDPTEAARLTGIPNLRRIWVKHNRFTKKYPNYRVTIFNLFRNTPGYTEDIFIDDYGPSYSERKVLVDRVPEVERLSVTQHREEPPSETASPIILHQAARHAAPASTQAEGMERSLSRPEPRKAQFDLAATSTGRRRRPRKRIVDLLQSEEVMPSVANDSSAPERNKQAPLAERSPVLLLGPMESGATNLEQAPRNSVDLERRMDATHIQPSEIPDRSRSFDYVNHGDDYRQRVEALRQEFGNNWISVLSDQGWDASRDLPRHESKPFSPPIQAMHRANSQAIVSSGRTLG